MQRDLAFQDLSRDHLVALLRALHVERALAGHPRAPSYDEAFDAFRRLWTHDGLDAHFLEEDTDLLPILQGGEPALAARLMDEHAALRRGFAALRREDPAATRGTADLLRRHARWEEDVVFPWLESHLSTAELARLRQESAAFRRSHGLPVGTTRG